MSDRGHIFIVDGNVSSADNLRNLLEKSGYAADCTTRGQDAFDAIQSAQPDLVLLDTHLPDKNPFTLCEELKGGGQTQYIPVIFITSFGHAEARIKGVELGDDVITKPFETREILARVERHVTVSKVRLALQESEAKFRSVMESAIDAIVSGDVSGNIRSWNRAATALFGFAEEEAIGNPIEIIIPERFRRSHREGMHRVSSGGPSHVIGKTVELAALHRDGHEFPVELSLATWFLDEDRYFTGIIRDISERKQAEQKFRSVTESAIDAIISANHTGEIVSWNSAATRILGYPADEAVGRQLELIIPERFHEAHRAGMKRVTAGGESHVIGSTVELFACTKSGKEIPIELSLATWTVRDERYYTGIIRDIRERKEAEEALRMSEQALRESTRELKIKNETLQRTLDKLHDTQNQLIVQEKLASLGKLSAGLAHELNNPAAAAQRGAAQLQTMLTQLQVSHQKISELNLEGEQLDTVMSLERLATEAARQPSDLDALTRSDRESEMEEWLEEHGIETAWELAPALVTLGYEKPQLMTLAEKLSPRQFPVVIGWLSSTHSIHSLVSEITVGTRRIVDIVKALKTYTYMDQAPIQAVDVHEGLDNTLIMFRNRLKAGITVRREYAQDLPKIQAFGSELNQVWTNIIDNAVDAMAGKGKLVLRTSTENSWVVVEIEDDGPGIPEEVLAKIFDPFFTTKPPGEGTGLGLNISRNLIVQRHHGQVDVSSEPGRTRFTVRLPIDIKALDQPEEESQIGEADHIDS